jgi:hypothetical protein
MRQACELAAHIKAQFERRCTCRHAGARHDSYDTRRKA